MSMFHRVFSTALSACKTQAVSTARQTVLVSATRTYRPTLSRFNAAKEPAIAELQEAAEATNGYPAVTLEQLEASGKIDRAVTDTIRQANFAAFTPVQQVAIMPTLEEEKGLVVRAKTGTGKTFAYLLPILAQLYPSMTHSIKNKHKVFHLVIVPTRDLAEQVELELKKMVFKRSPLTEILNRVSVMTGARRVLFESLFCPSIVIATPGRLMAFLREKRHLRKFARLQSVVIDEADRLLDAGFEQDLLDIHRSLQSINTQYEETGVVSFKTVLYSATIDQNVDKFAKKYIGDDYKFIDCVGADAGEAHENVDQQLIQTNSMLESIVGSFKFVLEGMQNADKEKFKAIVFLPTQTGVEWYNEMMRTYVKSQGSFSRRDVQVMKLHGKMSQNSRNRVVQFFRRAKSSVIICTDIAARGLDFPDVTHVIQTGPSVEIANYIHKIGRTARAGTKGKALLYLPKTNQNFAKALTNDKSIEFNTVVPYETFDQDIEYLSSHYDHNTSDSHGGDEILEEFVRTYLGYAKSVSSIYKIDQLQIFEEILHFLRFYHSDKETKIDVGASFLKNVLGVSRRDAEAFFEVPDDYNFQGRRGSRGGNYGGSLKGNRFGRFDQNSRGGARNNSNSDSRSGGSSYRSRDSSYSNRGRSSGSNYGSRDGYESRSKNSYSGRSNNSDSGDREYSSKKYDSRSSGNSRYTSNEGRRGKY